MIIYKNFLNALNSFKVLVINTKAVAQCEEKSFVSNQKGLALVEFALLAPLFITLFFGVVELTRYVMIVQKMERASYAITNMVGQYLPAQTPNADPANLINVNNMNNLVFLQLPTVMSPYNNKTNDNIRAIVTSVVKTANAAPNDIIVKWQIASTAPNGTLVDKDNNTVVSIVNGLAPSAINAAVLDTPAPFTVEIQNILADTVIGENIIVAEVFYAYQPLNQLASAFLAPRTLVSRTYTMPRQGNLLYLPPTFPVPPGS